jgi:hypothetical protein
MSATEHAVRRVLKQAGGQALCAACLALACEAPLTAMRERIERLLQDHEHFRGGATCARCGRAVATIVYHNSA